MKIVIDNQIPYIKGVFEPYAEVIYLTGNEITRDSVVDADTLIVRTRTRCDRALLEDTRVLMIASATIGFDHIDMEYCDAAGIKVVTAAGSNARAVLQWMGAALVYAAQVGGWEPSQKTIGVVGVGHVGSLVAEYAHAWGFEVLCCDPPRARAEGLACAKNTSKTSDSVDTGCAEITTSEVSAEGAEYPSEYSQNGIARFVSFEEITRRCDIITFHTPLTHTGPDATYHAADAAFFASIRPGTLIINTSRGEVINSDALLSAVIAGRCACCIDTWENEPDIDRALLANSLLATPHIAGYSAQGKANATAAVVRAVSREHSLPLEFWYPEVQRTEPVPISWKTLQATIAHYFDIHAQSRALKAHPECFEYFRNTYIYREEYF